MKKRFLIITLALTTCILFSGCTSGIRHKANATIIEKNTTWIKEAGVWKEAYYLEIKVESGYETSSRVSESTYNKYSVDDIIVLYQKYSYNPYYETEDGLIGVDIHNIQNYEFETIEESKMQEKST